MVFWLRKHYTSFLTGYCRKISLEYTSHINLFQNNFRARVQSDAQKETVPSPRYAATQTAQELATN